MAHRSSLPAVPEMQHHVGRIAIDVTAPSLGDALVVRARVEDIAATHFPAAIARVFDAATSDDTHIEIDRIDIDLGRIAADKIEADVPAALERALGDALRDLLRVQATGPGATPARYLSHARAEITDFEYYLVHGVARMGARAEAPVQAFRRLLDQPAALVEMLRRNAQDRRALERLVLQLGERELRALLRQLAPADAALILRYHAALHGLVRQSETALSEPAMRRAFWMLSLEYLLREPGSQFNRRTFVAHLLHGIATAHGISYAAMLGLIERALEHTRRQRPLSGSLPSVLHALIAEQVPSAADAPSAADGADTLERRLRAAAREPARLSAMVRLLDAETFARIVQRLEPAHAAAILAHLDGLAQLHAGRKLLALSQRGFVHWLWLLTIRHLLRDAGSRFNRRSWLERLLRRMAAIGGVSYAFLLDGLGQALAVLRRQTPLAGSLPIALADLAADLALAPLPDDDGAIAERLLRYRDDDRAVAALLAGLSRAAFAAVLARLAPDGAPGLRAAIDALCEAQDHAPLAPLSPQAWEQRLWLAAFRALHPAAGAATQRKRFAAALAQIPGVDAARIDACLGGGAGALPIVAPTLATVLAQRDAATAGAVRADIALLAGIHAAAPLSALDHARFRALAETLAAHALQASGTWDRRAFRRALLRGVATHDGPQRAAPLNWTTLERMGAEIAADSRPALLAAAETFLRTGTPSAFGPRLVECARADPRGFAALLRRLSVAHSGRTAALRQRLLLWMLPEEIVAVLLPEDSGHAATLAAALADAAADTLAAGWAQVLDAALNDAVAALAPPPAALLGGPDRVAILRHWLDRGSLPWWAQDRLRVDAVAAWLDAASGAALATLLADGDAAQTALRLHRALSQLGTRRGAALLAKLAPECIGTADTAHIRAVATALCGAAAVEDGAPLSTRPAPAPETPPPAAVDDDAALLRWLAGGDADAPAAHRARWLRRIATLADRGDPALDVALRQGLALPEARARWAEQLPEEILTRIVYRLAPARARLLLDAGALLAQAWRRAAPAEAHRARAEVAALLLALVAAEPIPAPRTAIEQLLERVAQRAGSHAPALRSQAVALTRQGQHAELQAAIRARHAPSPPDRPTAPIDAPAGDAALPLYIANAGLVLLHPYLPRLFEQLGVLAPDAEGRLRIAAGDAATRAVHTLQYLVDQRLDAPEPELALNKLLCGLPIDTPVAPSTVLEEADLALCASLTTAVLANWPALNNSSPDALRETFLQRAGRIAKSEDRWTITVERRTLDVLVDQIPWGFRLMFHPWMEEPLHVEW
ncbi:contractile injection system tape measure protein [Sphingomonas sp. CJ20]